MAVIEQRRYEGTEGREAAKLLRHVRSIADMTSEVASAHDFSTSARFLLLTLLGALSATRGAIWLYDPGSETLRPSVARGLDVEEAILPLRESDAEGLLDTTASIMLDDGVAAPPAVAILRERWPELVAAAPLAARGALIGLLAVGAKLNRQPYSDSEREVLSILATLAASGIHSHNLIAGLQQANQRLIDTQEQLIRSEQLAALGATTAGIAHEIGNPLTSILGYAITIREMSGEMTTDLLQELLEPILNESERLKLILEELKDYAKPKGYEMEPLSLSTVIEESTRFTRYDRLFRGTIQVQCVYDSDPVVLINRNKIKQVLLNLLRNAAQAIAASAAERPPSIAIRVGQDGGLAAMSVIDNGPGIPPDKLDAIWQPFYTTKGNEGTGLGLDLCKQIIERHHGTIWVESEVGAGATFTIQLPVYPGPDTVRAGAGEVVATAT
jgi:signal transduction histidine kinase